MSLFGSVRCRRHYYYCPHCRRGHCPWDQTLGLTAQDLTPAVEQLVSLAGLLSSFAEAAQKVLPPLAGLRVAASTVERTTEAVGQRLGEALAASQTFGPAHDWAWHRDAEGKTVAYVGADATGVGQQGEGGVKAEGRMANVAMLYNPVPEERPRWARPKGPRPAWQARYLASLEPLATLGESLRRQAAQVGMDRAERWIALSDGGSGLEEFLQTHFPRVQAVILDFYHAAEHLGDLAQAWHPADAAAAAALRSTWSHQLKHQGGQAVLGTLRELDLRGRSPAARECHRQVQGYFENHQHRMDYPRYQAKGWHIGSGPVESACKTVVGQRLKGAGMRWSEAGADALCRLRALFKSERGPWEAFWNPSRN